MASNFFSRARNTRIGCNSVFQHVEGDVNHNYLGCPTCQEQEEDRIMPKQKRYREISEGDVYFGEQTWSQEMKVVIRTRNSNKTRIAVLKRFHTATLYPHNRTVTVVSFEPSDKKDSNTTRLLWNKFYEAYSAQRSLRLVQMLGLMTARMPTFILYEELVNGQKFVERYDRKGHVFAYLFHTSNTAISALRADKALRIPVSDEWEDWTFNPKAQSWHYDASASLNKASRSSFYTPIQLPEGPLPQLDANEITTYFENTFGDLLYLIASSGKIEQEFIISGRIEQLDVARYARHDRFTFGAVIDYWESGNLAHFPSTPRPEWCFENWSYNIVVSYSEKIHSRVDFQFYNTDNTHLDLNFTLRLPLEVRTRLRAAYLCQSEKRSNRETFFIDEVGFSITGNLSHNPTTSLAYLFIPPLDAEYIDGMYCVPDPPPYPLFYWSWDTEGKTMISEEDWEQAGVPELAIDMCIGSCWEDFEYDMVKRHLRKKKYAVDGKQYAQDHGYPELIWGDPHDHRIEEAEEMNSNDDWENSGKHVDSKKLDENKPCSSTSQHKSSSPLLLVDPPLEGMSAYFGDRDILHARNMESSVEEIRCFEQQIARHANRSNDVAQKSNPNKLFPTFGFDRSNPSQGAIGVPVDSHHNAFTRLTP
ncbi:hypothetical protein PQX77_019728, partial [Marasmius sp. AFHP31]